MLSIFDEFDQSYNINNNNFGFQNLFIYEMPNF